MIQLDVLVSDIVRRLGLDMRIDVGIPDIEERIEKIKAEIKRITETDPYLYKNILKDEQAKKEKHDELDAEEKTYHDYSKELDEALADVMKGGVTLVWQMN